MTTETEIEEICRRLGWGIIGDSVVEPCADEPTVPYQRYHKAETNADLHMRWMVEHDIGTAHRAGFWFGLEYGGTCVTDAESTPHEAIRAALLAKLRSEQDG